MPLPAKLLSVPPSKVMSARLKSVLSLLSLKMTVVTSPTSSTLLAALISMVGTVLSEQVQLKPSETELSRSAPSLLKLPAPSLKRSLLTRIIAPCEVAKGVKVAV